MKFKVGDRVRVWAERYEADLLSIDGNKGTIACLEGNILLVRFDLNYVGAQGWARVFPKQCRRLVKKKSKPREFYMPTKIKTKTMWQRLYKGDGSPRFYGGDLFETRQEALQGLSVCGDLFGVVHVEVQLVEK